MVSTRLVIFPLCLTLFIASCKKDDPTDDGSDEPTEEVVSNFSADPTTIVFGESVQFTDESSGNPNTWSWSFEGGTPGTSTEQNPTVIFEDPGAYGVTLVAGNDASENSFLRPDYIIVEAPQFFTEPKFDEFTKTTDIVYGVDQSQHKLSVFEPAEDPRTNRPMIILAGGGGFVGSDLSLLEPFAEEMTRYGFVVATAGYRSGPTTPSIEYQTMLIKGLQDNKAMIRYFKEKAHVWDIDTTLIFNGGYGSGGIISLMATYFDESELDANALAFINSLGGLEGEQGNPNHSSDVAGMVSLAGGLYGSLSNIDAYDPGIFAVHGTMDFDIPYDSDTTSSGTDFFGSLPITLKADSVGLPNELFTIENGFHDAPPVKVKDYSSDLAVFLKSLSE